MGLRLPKNTAYRGLPSPDSKDFLLAVKEAIEGLLGQRGNELDRAATIRDLFNPVVVNFLNSQAESVTQDGISTIYSTVVPDPPTNLKLVTDAEAGRIAAFEHNLTWTAPDDDVVSHTEVWVSESASRAAASLLGIVTYPGHEYTHVGPNPTKNYWYWIRSVSYGGVASTWSPVDPVNGYLVEGEDSIQDTIENILEALRGVDPATYNPVTTYYVGNRVKYTGADSNIRAYVCIDDDGGSGISGVAPTDTDHWKRSGPFITGQVDGVTTVALDGNMVVDGTIVTQCLDAECVTTNKLAATSVTAGKIATDAVEADKIKAGAVTAGKISVSELSAIAANIGTCTAGLVKSSDGKIQLDLTNKWLKVWDASAVLRVHIGYIA